MHWRLCAWWAVSTFVLKAPKLYTPPHPTHRPPGQFMSAERVRPPATTRTWPRPSGLRLTVTLSKCRPVSYTDTNHDGLVAYINKDVVFEGGFTVTNWITPSLSDNPTFLDGEGINRVLYVEGVSPTISGFRFFNGKADSGGCVFLDNSDAVLIGNIVDTCRADYGGGLMIWEGSPSVIGNTFAGNEATHEGGAVNVFSSTLLFQENLVANNEADTNGGGMSIFGGYTRLLTNTIHANTTITAGGGINLHSAHALIQGNLIQRNWATTVFEKPQMVAANESGWGGGMMVTQSSVELRDNTIVSNTAFFEGGGLNFNGSVATLRGNTISGNEAWNVGGGLSWYNSTVDIGCARNQIYGNMPDQVSPPLLQCLGYLPITLRGK